MRILALLFLFTMNSALAGSDCAARVVIDPVFSNQVTKAVEKALKDKRYKILSSSDDHWEQFRLYITLPGVTLDGQVTQVVSVGLQKFMAPNFEYIFKKAPPIGKASRDERAIEYLKDLPSCPQALYTEVFTSLQD